MVVSKTLKIKNDDSFSKLELAHTSNANANANARNKKICHFAFALAFLTCESVERKRKLFALAFALLM